MLVMLWNMRKERKDLFWLAFGLLASIPAQAVIGGITVLTGLNPYVVSLHFLVSAALVVVSMLLVNRTYGRTGHDRPGRRRPPAPASIRRLSVVAAVPPTWPSSWAPWSPAPARTRATPPRRAWNSTATWSPASMWSPCTSWSPFPLLLVILLWRSGRGDILRSAAMLLFAARAVPGLHWLLAVLHRHPGPAGGRPHAGLLAHAGGGHEHRRRGPAPRPGRRGSLLAAAPGEHSPAHGRRRPATLREGGRPLCATGSARPAPPASCPSAPARRGTVPGRAGAPLTTAAGDLPCGRRRPASYLGKN